MKAASSIRMSTRFAILLLFVLIPQLWIVPGHASSITLEWADPFDDKVLFIEAGATKLFETKLEGDSLKVDADTMVQHGAPYTAATVGLEGIDDMAIVVNLFKCSAPCDFRISYAPLESSPARTVSRICKANPKPMDSQFKKYFFCRKVYQINSAANGKCWPETLSALTGWFDAAYKLHEMTLRDGIGFVARDLEIETLIQETLIACPSFEATVNRNPGYFKGMIKNLDIAILQQTQRVQRSLAADKPVEAQDLAENIVKQLDAAEPIRNAVSSKEAAFVESVVNRALMRDAQFSLR